MKHVVSEKYNVAWFKLADCIARGEKERALGVYRLLSHSFDDKALACQLHADILLSFNDENAEATYKKAAEMYREQERYLQAAAVYEHLVTLQPHTVSYRTMLIALYQQLRIHGKVMEYVESLVLHLLAKSEWKLAIEMAQRFALEEQPTFMARLHEHILFHLISMSDVLPDTILDHARAAIDGWQAEENYEAIGHLLARMMAIDKKMGTYASEYWQKKGKK
jgi:tetratricopeptide (TPR) repeat protein